VVGRPGEKVSTMSLVYSVGHVHGLLELSGVSIGNDDGPRLPVEGFGGAVD
jgi:hypothetical protein